MGKEFLKLDNEINIRFKIKPLSPLLIKLGEGKNKEKSNSVICWTYDKTYSNKNINIKYEKDKKIIDEREGSIYIPGSTLKGMFRNHFYKIFNCLGEKPLDEFGEKLEKSVSKDEMKFEEVYQKSDDISKLFGSKVLKARFFAQDAIIINKKFTFDDLKKRSITPIDRFTGGAIVPLEFEYTEEEFTFDLKIRNIELEELQKLYFTIRDSINGEIRIGNSKTRGFGQIKLEIEDFAIEIYKNKSKKLNFIDKFSNVDETLSKKIGPSYLSKVYQLKNEFKKVDVENPNDFIKTLFQEGDK